jgi:hypothetical protein
MSHLLVIKDKSGKELARVPVEAGWTFKEMPLPKEAVERKSDSKVKDMGVGDSGAGKDKVG